MDQDAVESVPCDAMIDVWRDEEGEAQYRMVSSSMYKDSTQMNSGLVDWLAELQDLLNKKNLLSNGQLRIYTRIKRGGASFRGHPNYRGLGPWRDWAWYDFGTIGRFLMHMWCFVVLPDMKGECIEYGGIVMEEGIFAVAEGAKLIRNDPSFASMDLICAIKKEVVFDEDQQVVGKTFYLADTDAIVAPACVVPNIGGPPHHYFYIEPREKWSGFFLRWLRSDLDDDMVITDDELEDAEEAAGDLSEDESVGEVSVATTKSSDS